MQNWEEEFRSVIADHFKFLREKDPAFSLRSLAKRAHLSPSAMSQLLRKKHNWRLSLDRAIEILHALEIDENKRNRLATLMGRHVPASRTELKSSDYEILKDWTYLPVLHSFDLNPPPAPDELAYRLGVSVDKVNEVIADLLARGYLKKGEDGDVYRDATHWETTDGPPNEAVRRHHKTNLELANRVLESVPAEKRYFMSMTFAGNKSQVDYLKTEIKKLFDNAAAIVEKTQPRDELFKLSVNFFPIDFEDAQEKPIESNL